VSPWLEVAVVRAGPKLNSYYVSNTFWLFSAFGRPPGRDLHSSTSQLNVCTLYGIRWVPSVYMWVVTRHELYTNGSLTTKA
jgi:hypothetical protein